MGRIALIFLAGWLMSLVISPKAVTGMFKGKAS
jgi:hypothetical protein